MSREQFLRNRLNEAIRYLSELEKKYYGIDSTAETESELAEASKTVGMLKTWLKEFRAEYSGAYAVYEGHISTVSYNRNIYGINCANEMEFQVDTGASFMYGDDRIFRLGAEVQEWFINDKGSCCGRYDREKDNRDSRKLRVSVDSINVVRAMEWADAE